MHKALNREHTPLIRYDNDFSKNPLEVRDDIKALSERQATKSPYEVGTLSSLTERIVHLEDELGMFERDINQYEKMYSGADPKYYMSDNLNADNSRKKDYPLVRNFRSAYRRQITGLNSMPLRYEAVVTPTPQTEEIVSTTTQLLNIEEDDLTPEDKNIARQMEGKPKFVEMYVFPGFEDSGRLEKLPYGVSLNKIIDSVIHSQPGMPNKKPRYAKWMRQMMMKSQCRCIILDLFWWFLLDKFKDHPSELLTKFETRISENYRTYIENVVPFDRYRDPFFNYFAPMLSQAIYACFCHVFPDSFSKYNDVFKERLLEICGEWFQGTKITSASWKTWNYLNLEPAGLRLRMEAAEAAAKEEGKRKKGLFSLDWVKNLGTQQGQQGQQGQGGHVTFADSEPEPPAYVETETKAAPTAVKPVRKDRGPVEYKQIGRIAVEHHLFDLAGHTPLITSSCTRKAADINNTGTHFLLQHHYVKPEVFEDEQSTFYRDASRRNREEGQHQIRKINGIIRSCHINEEKRNKKMRELDKEMEEFLTDKDRVRRMADVLTLKSMAE